MYNHDYDIAFQLDEYLMNLKLFIKYIITVQLITISPTSGKLGVFALFQNSASASSFSTYSEYVIYLFKHRDTQENLYHTAEIPNLEY